jgi:hypothetical protein
MRSDGAEVSIGNAEETETGSADGLLWSHVYVAGAQVHLTDPQGLNAVHIAAVGREGSPQQCEQVMNLLLASAQQQGTGYGEMESWREGLRECVHTHTHTHTCGLASVCVCVCVSLSVSACNRLMAC